MRSDEGGAEVLLQALQSVFEVSGHSQNVLFPRPFGDTRPCKLLHAFDVRSHGPAPCQGCNLGSRRGQRVEREVFGGR